MELIDKCKRVVKQFVKHEDNILAFLRTEDEDLKENYFYGDGMLQIWLSKNEKVIYIRSLTPEPKQIVYINESKQINEVDEDIVFQISHINSLLKEGPITLYVCPSCKEGSKEVDWDDETVKPLKGRLYRYTSIIAVGEEDKTPFCCPKCKENSYIKDIEKMEITQ